ncbi:hypothetical protein KIPB_009767 [Kipferlia bialata]|uniref:Uncharacterized protein n=1 Tax=Kipferlia bialata TaxID=797122 RepID=A0A9K3D2T7_9EUKA|nr:hypothetical protein KIPB_009767 [Kipferlia bialata]|eukprot:g9767.t1
MGCYFVVVRTHPDGTPDVRENEYGDETALIVDFRIGSWMGDPWSFYFVPVYIAAYRRIQLLEPWNTEALAAIESVVPPNTQRISRSVIEDPAMATILAEAGLGPCKALLYGARKMPIELIRQASVMMESLRDHLAWEEEDLDDTPWSSETYKTEATHTPYSYQYTGPNSNKDCLAESCLIEDVFDAFALGAQESFAYATLE